MKNSDFSVSHTGLNNLIQCVSTLTIDAQPRSEFEVHTHYKEFEIYYFLEGDLYFAFEGNRFPVENGTMIIISNGTLHCPIIKSSCRYLRKRILFTKEIFTGFNISSFELYTALRKKKFMLFGKKDVETLQLDKLFNKIEESLSCGKPYEDFSALINLFQLLIIAEKNVTPYDFYNSSLYSEKAFEIIKYIDEHLTDTLSYKSLSELFYISEKNLYKFFKNETGFTLSDYITERRIIKAQSSLNAGESASTAAVLSGFKDYSVFYRSFLRKTGITPTEYIKNINKI